jgi:predicted acetyltransferase
LPLERTRAAFDRGDIVGTLGTFPFDVTAPGGTAVPMGGTTVVTVQPTHRRQGVLTAMMRAHLEEVAAAGEPLAGLWASESVIYGRYGYGMASEHYDTSMEAARITFREPPTGGSLRLIDPAEAAEVLPRIYEGIRLRRPGMLSRSAAWWKHRRLRDPTFWREGRSARRTVVYERDGEAVAYATYRQKEKWEEFFAHGEVSVVEVMTADREAHASIWDYLTNIDLFPRVTCWNLPVDDPLTAMITDRRRVVRRREDALWLRILDVEEAMTSRRYEIDGATTLEVRDEFRPQTAATYRLEVHDGRAECHRIEDEPEVSLGIDVLSGLYLGGGDVHALRAAGRIGGAAESVWQLGRLLHTRRAPWCPEIF